MSTDLRSAGWGRGVAAAVLLIVINLAVALAGEGTRSVLPATDPRWLRGLLAGLVLALLTALALRLAVGFLFRRRRPEPAAFGLVRPQHVVRSMAVFIGLLIPTFFVAGFLTYLIGLKGTTEIDTTGDPLGYRIYLAVLGMVAAPWLEEVAIRGFLLSALHRRFGFWPAAVVSALAWSGLHLAPGVVILIAAEGVLLAMLRRRTGSVLPGVGFHTCQNALALATTGAGVVVLPVLIAQLLSVRLAAVRVWPGRGYDPPR